MRTAAHRRNVVLRFTTMDRATPRHGKPTKRPTRRRREKKENLIGRLVGEVERLAVGAAEEQQPGAGERKIVCRARV